MQRMCQHNLRPHRLSDVYGCARGSLKLFSVSPPTCPWKGADELFHQAPPPPPPPPQRPACLGLTASMQRPRRFVLPSMHILRACSSVTQATTWTCPRSGYSSRPGSTIVTST